VVVVVLAEVMGLLEAQPQKRAVLVVVMAAAEEVLVGQVALVVPLV
jgi:hypothetical protein